MEANPQYTQYAETSAEYYSRQILPGDPEHKVYVPNQLLKMKGHWDNGGTVNNPGSQWAHHPDGLANDLRLEYYNPNVPWLESLSRFVTIPTEAPYVSSYNSAHLRIPARKGPGNYLAWFTWRGYFDVIDVNVRDSPVPNDLRYGNYSTGADAAAFTRFDHCEFTNQDEPITPCRIVKPSTMNIQQCLTDCANNANCDEVQVTRISNPPGTLDTFPNIPTTVFNNSQWVDAGYFMRPHPVWTGPCGAHQPHFRHQMGCSVKGASVRLIHSFHTIQTLIMCAGARHMCAMSASRPQMAGRLLRRRRTRSSTRHATSKERRGLLPYPAPAYPRPTNKWQGGRSLRQM